MIARVTQLFAIAAVIGVVVLLFRMSALEARLAHAVKQAPAAMPAAEGAGAHGHEEGEDVEVAVFMGRIDRYHERWWLAAKNNNVPLAEFYLHEMEEAMETIAEAHIVDDKVDVSANMRTYGLPVVKQLQDKLERQGTSDMHDDATLLMNTCNSCHAACGFPYIRIRTPQEAFSPGLEMRPS